MAVNKEQGVIGIPAVWDGKTLIQCFGPGIAARAGAPLGYTFFYDPAGTTTGQKAAALDQSKSEGGSVTPGYPRSCPDGSSIDSGTCVDDTPVKGAPDTGIYGLVSVPGVMSTTGLNGRGENYSSYCSGDLPPAAVTSQSTLTIGGLPASIDYIYPYGGSVCVDSNGNPPHAAGKLDVVLTNPNGSTARGTVTYVDAVGAAPVVSSLSPRTGPFDAPTTVTVTGENFTPGTKVIVEYAKDVPVRFISSTQIEFTMPTAATVGYEAGYGNVTASLMVVNPDSDYVEDTFEYAEPGNGGGGGGTSGPTGPWKFVPGMTTAVLVSEVGTAGYDEMGVQNYRFATYRAVEACSFFPGVGQPTTGGAFCIPALKADYEEWDGHTAGTVASGNMRQFGYVLSDGEHTYTFLESYDFYTTETPTTTMYSGVVSGPLGTPPSVPWPPQYGCDGYCNDPRYQ